MAQDASARFRIMTTAAVAFLAALLFFAAPSAAQTDGEEESVFRVIVTTAKGVKSGSAFLIAGQKVLATNQHVIADAKKIEIYLAMGGAVAYLPATVLDSDEDKDLALLLVEANLPGDPLPLATYDPRIDSRAIAIGFPGAADIVSESLDPNMLRPSVTSGNFSRIVPQTTGLGGARVLQHQAPISGGNSGGPLLDECHAVIGVNTFIPDPKKGAQGIFFSVHAAELVRFARKNAIDVTALDEPCTPGQPPLRAGAKPGQEPETSDRVAEIHTFTRFVRCSEASPCEARTCRARYERRALETLAQNRKGELELIVTHSASSCADQKERQELANLVECSRKSPCYYASQCEGVFLRTVSKETAERRHGALEEVKKSAEELCREGRRSPVAIQRPEAKPDVKRADPRPAPRREAAVAPRDYFADLRYDSSEKRNAEIPHGNCLDKRIKMTVTRDFQVFWELIEGTRRSIWRGQIDADTGEIAVDRDGVQIETNEGGGFQTPGNASVTGSFARSRIVFDPCGAGYITVRG